MRVTWLVGMFAMILWVRLPVYSANGSEVSILQSFSLPIGAGPVGGVTSDGTGGFYGQTISGGSTCIAAGSRFYLYKPGCGVVYHLDRTGHYTALFRFDGSDGAYGESGLSLIGDRLFGTTISGTSGHRGRIFSLKTDGTGFSVVHRFDGADGSNPITPPIQGPDGSLYGVTVDGGIGRISPSGETGNGILYRVTPQGRYQILHSFTGGYDGYFPVQIIVGPNGLLYGSSELGGNGGLGGVIWSYDPSKSAFQVIRSFSQDQFTPDGVSPALGGFSADGTLYGVTRYGGADDDGTIFALNLHEGSVTFTTLLSFFGYYSAYDAPTVSASGALTLNVGPILYRYASGNLSTLFTFTTDFTSTAPDGNAFGKLVVGPSGVIFGTSTEGGYSKCANHTLGVVTGCGTIWAVTR